MRAAPSLFELLDQSSVSYKTEIHPYAATAQGVAEAEHVTGFRVAKTVVVKVKGQFKMLVLAAPKKVDFDALKAHFKETGIRLATENELQGLFPDCEVGAMPPVGELYHLEVFVDEAVAKEPEIIFNAGTHTETIEMRYADFNRLTRPQVFRFAH